ncbi:hypothetical protein ACWDRB_27765 [Nonomuraea sp. NPDC003707]
MKADRRYLSARRDDPVTSGAPPGKAHDLSAARIWGILRALDQAGIITLADKAYQGAAPVHDLMVFVLIASGVAAVVIVFVLAAWVDGGGDVDAAGAGARGCCGDPGHLPG